MSGTFYLAPESDAHGFGLSQFISLLGISPASAGTFRPDPGAPLETAWEVWQETLFLPKLAPAFITAFEAASTHHIVDIVACDHSLHEALNVRLRDWSLEAARPFLEGKSEMRAHREWARFAEQVTSGDSPGHLCILFAVQSALFHLPLPAALAAYASYEFRCRRERFPFPEMTPEESEAFSSVLPRIPLAVRRNAADNHGGDGTLRVV